MRLGSAVHSPARRSPFASFTETREKTIVCRHTWDRPSASPGAAGLEETCVDANSERLLTPGEVAALFRVDPKTVTRWAASGRISSIRTPGGHRRFRESEVRALLRGEAATVVEDRRAE
jgi:excisionase family DNA binding protein